MKAWPIAYVIIGVCLWMSNNSKKFTDEEIIEGLKNFQAIYNYLKREYSVWESGIQETDWILSDIYHKIEFDYPIERTNKTKAVRMMHDTLKKRRYYKDKVLLYQNFINDIAREKQYESFLNTLFNKIKEIKKTKEKIDNGRVYVPRVLKEEPW